MYTHTRHGTRVLYIVVRAQAKDCAQAGTRAAGEKREALAPIWAVLLMNECVLSEAERPADDKAGDQATDGHQQVPSQAGDGHHGQHEARQLRERREPGGEGADSSRWGQSR